MHLDRGIYGACIDTRTRRRSRSLFQDQAMAAPAAPAAPNGSPRRALPQTTLFISSCAESVTQPIMRQLLETIGPVDGLVAYPSRDAFRVNFQQASHAATALGLDGTPLLGRHIAVTRVAPDWVAGVPRAPVNGRGPANFDALFQSKQKTPKETEEVTAAASERCAPGSTPSGTLLHPHSACCLPCASVRVVPCLSCPHSQVARVARKLAEIARHRAALIPQLAAFLMRVSVVLCLLV